MTASDRAAELRGIPRELKSKKQNDNVKVKLAPFYIFDMSF